MMTQLPSMTLSGTEQLASAVDEAVLSREVLEYAVLLSVKLEDEESFERNFLQLETYYFDQITLPQSEKQSLMLGLQLMLLLVQKRTAEFHMELERIPSHFHETDEFVKYAIELEQRLMEGSYHKVLTSKDNLPAAEYYGYFIDQLEMTVREEIASCCEKAYSKLKVPHAAKLMMVDSTDEMVRYAEDKIKEDLENGEVHGGDTGTDVVMAGDTSFMNHKSAWAIHDGEIHFKPNLHPETPELSSLDIIKRTLMYARELERIV
eukprot:g7904.t1